MNRRSLLFALLALALPACASQINEKVRLYNDDGIVLFQQGNVQGAKETFEAALVMKPGDAHLEFNLGRCYDRLGNTAKAEELYRTCLQEIPNHPECRHALAVLLAKTGRRKDMDALVDDWLKREPGRADPYVEDAWRLRQDGELLKAQARLQQALEMEPKNGRALAELGLVFELLEYPERARALYERALELNPDQPEVTEQLHILCSRGVGRPRPN